LVGLDEARSFRDCFDGGVDIVGADVVIDGERIWGEVNVGCVAIVKRFYFDLGATYILSLLIQMA
jgi:hypothetical protein